MEFSATENFNKPNFVPVFCAKPTRNNSQAISPIHYLSWVIFLLADSITYTLEKIFRDIQRILPCRELQIAPEKWQWGGSINYLDYKISQQNSTTKGTDQKKLVANPWWFLKINGGVLICYGSCISSCGYFVPSSKKDQNIHTLFFLLLGYHLICEMCLGYSKLLG